ncbi:MAG TPA: family 16 glycosylhydrolase [Kineosporiaceae bacterium]|nr:family 16 glycosylhydrolase [Kineosporiaceae bacterium]
MIRKALAAALAAAATCAFLTPGVAQAADQPASGLDRAGYKLFFDDEFDGSTLDTAKWYPYLLPHWAANLDNAKANYGFETLNGAKSLVLKIDSSTPFFDTASLGNLRASGIQTLEKDYLHIYNQNIAHYPRTPFDNGFNTKYGYFETRMKLPDTGGGGHAAWWMVGAQDDGLGKQSRETAEIDVMEPLYSKSTEFNFNLYSWADPDLHNEVLPVTMSPGKNDSTEFHVYGFDWSPEGMKFYVDGELKAQTTQSPNYRMATIFSMYASTDSSYWSGQDNGVYPKKWYIDYFRVYKKQDNLARLATASATTVNSNFPVTRLNDGQDQTGYLSADNPSFPQYATLKWVSGQTFNTVNLKSAWSQGQAPKNWDIEVSDDGDTGWTKVASSGDVTWSKNDSTVETKTVKFATVRNKKGVRLKVNSAYLSWNHYYITEFEVFKSNEALDAVASTTHDPVYGYGINRVNDGRDSTSNLSPDNPTLPQYITLRWDQARTVGNVGLKAFYAQGQAPTSWDVEVSDDGTTNWRRVAQSGTVVWQYNDATVESKYVNFNQETVKGLRVKINTANLQWKHYAVNEIEAY